MKWREISIISQFLLFLCKNNRMIEKAPEYKQEETTINLMVNIQMSGILKAIQDEYLYWDKVKYKAANYNPIEFWNAIKLDRKLKGNKIQFGNYSFSFVITDFMQRALHQFDLNIGGTLGSNIGIAETDKTKFIMSSIMEEAISSSQMEGANTTRKKAKEMIQKEQKPTTKSEQMITNNYETMKHIIQHKNDDLTSGSLLEIHKLITNKTLEKAEDEGNFRENDEIFVANHSSGEIVHIPPQKEELEALIKELCVFFNRDSKEYFIHPIIKACAIHFMIGWIHPFSDGNGRTARTLFYWYMLKKGYWLTEYLSISRIIKDTKNQYEKAYLYTETDENDLSYFITYHFKTMEKAYEALKEYIGKKQKEVVQAAKFLKIPGINERMAQVIKIINDDPDRILSIKELEKRFNISNFTARADLKALVEWEFLEIIQVNKIKQNFVKSKKFEEILRNNNV